MRRRSWKDLRDLTDRRFGRILSFASTQKRVNPTDYCIKSTFVGWGLCLSVVIVPTRVQAEVLTPAIESKQHQLSTTYAQADTADTEEQSKEESSESSSNNFWSFDFGAKELLITSGFLGILLQQWSSGRDARRSFAQATTDKISTLASDHYWPLANYAGVVAGLLEDYLEEYSYYLILRLDSKDDLRGKLDEISEKSVKVLFPYFCRLIGLFYEFQFSEGNTYLLTGHRAGETCKQLYNTFLKSFPDEKLVEDFAGFYALKIRADSLNSQGRQSEEQNAKLDDTVSQSEEGSQKEEAKRVYEILPADLTEAIIEEYVALKEGKQRLHQWLRHDLANVVQAADALRAYNELLNHELANLYRDWFSKRLIFRQWPDVITEQSRMTIEQVSLQPVLLSPLGGAVSTAPMLSQTSIRELESSSYRNTDRSDDRELLQINDSPPINDSPLRQIRNPNPQSSVADPSVLDNVKSDESKDENFKNKE